MPPPSHPCACGCGTLIPEERRVRSKNGQRYAKGHWLRLHRLGSVFLSLDDTPEDAPPTLPSLLDRPAGQLLSAVFVDAWDHRQECPRRQAGRSCGQCARDRVWAAATAATWCYSFESACEYLGIEADRARAVFVSTAG